MALAWSHTVLMVKDGPEMLDFYTRVLGFQVTDQGDLAGGRYIYFLSQQPDEHHQIGMVTNRTDDGPPNSLAHMAFRVDGMGELRDMIDRIEGESLAYRPTSHGSTWSIYFQDPEQNGIEIFCDTPWHVAQPQGKTWDVSADDETLLAWTKDTFEGEPGFEPKETYHSRMADKIGQA